MDRTQSPQSGPLLTHEQLDFIKDRVERGADPQALSHWLARVNDLGEGVREQVQAAGEDFQAGRGHRWYAAVLHDGPRCATLTSTDALTMADPPVQHRDRG